MLTTSTDPKVSSTLTSCLARYFCICPYDTTGKFSPALFACCCIFTVCLISVDFSIAFNVLYLAYVKNSHLEVYNKSLAVALDVVMNCGLIVNMWTQSTRKKILQRSHSSTYEFNINIHVFTLFSIVLTIVALIVRFFERSNSTAIANLTAMSAQNVDHLWYSIYCISTFVYFLIASLYGTLMNSVSIKTRKLTESRKPGSLKPDVLGFYIRSHHMQLAQLSRLHKVYSKQLFCASLDIFFDCVFNGYYVITYSIMGDGGVLFGVGYGAGIVVKILTLFVICTSCSNAQSHKRLVMVVQARRTVTFTAGGFFKLENGLIVSMLAAITTYLVMLVQCSQLKSSK